MTRLPAIVAALTLATACAVHQAPARPSIATGITDRTGISTSGLPLPGRDWTPPPGISTDDGLTQDEAAAIALWNNARFQAALTSLGIARADLIDAGLLKNPVLSLLFPWGPKQLEFTASWSIDTLWQRPKRIADAKLNAEAVASELVASGVNLVADVRLAFLDAIVAGRRAALAAEQADIATRLAGLARSRLNAGDISEFEEALSKTDALRLETARLSHAAARDLADIRLRTLLGLAQDGPPLRLTAPPGPAGCRPPPDLIKAALASRPDVRAAELHIEAAGARAGLEKARIMAFTASLDANAKGSEGFEMGPGVAIELPILSQNQGKRSRAAAELEQASRNYLAIRAAIAAEVSAARVGVTTAEGIARLLGPEISQTLAAARRQAERLHEAGEISLLDLLTIRQRLLDTEAARVDAELAVNRARARLEQALGNTCEVK
ncbi:MAG TPA: TolC family protein [Vicinamibacterales bacterium]|nr:TolC family protein [Vicinamibacterales bacterium]